MPHPCGYRHLTGWYQMSVYEFIRPVPRIASRVPSPGSRRRGCTPRCYQISQVSRCRVLVFVFYIYIFLTLPCCQDYSKRLSTRLPVLSGYTSPPFIALPVQRFRIRSAEQPKIRSSLALTSTAAARPGRVKPLHTKKRQGGPLHVPFISIVKSCSLPLSHQRLVTKPRTCQTVQALPHTNPILPLTVHIISRQKVVMTRRGRLSISTSQSTNHSVTPSSSVLMTAATWPAASPVSRETPYALRPPSASEILPRLFVSDLAFAENPASLASLGVTHVLSAMCGHVAIPHNPHLQHVQCDLEDLPFAELVDKLPGTTKFLRDALRDPNARVLVHCVEGVSRSTSVVCAFLIAEYGYTTERAIQYVKSKRRSAEPNFGFVQQLREYANKLQRL